MRYRVNNYTIEPTSDTVWIYFTAPAGVELSSDPDNEIEPFILDAIRLVVDESNEIVFCSSMQKRKYISRAKCNLGNRTIRLAFNIPSGKTVSSVDAFTIEMDWGEAIGDVQKAITDKIDAIPIPNDYAKEGSVSLLDTHIQGYINDKYSLISGKFDIVDLDFRRVFGEEWSQDTPSLVSIQGDMGILKRDTATKTDLDVVQHAIIGTDTGNLSLYTLKDSILGTNSSVSLKDLNSSLNALDGSVAKSSTVNDILDSVRVDNQGSITSVYDIASIVKDSVRRIDGVQTKTVIDELFDSNHGLSIITGAVKNGNKTVLSELGDNGYGLNAIAGKANTAATNATNAKTAADNANTAAGLAKDAAINAESKAGEAKTASLAAQTAAEGVIDSVKDPTTSKTVIEEILNNSHGLTPISTAASNASTKSNTIESKVSNGTYGLAAIKGRVNDVYSLIETNTAAILRAIGGGGSDKTVEITSEELEYLVNGDPIEIGASVEEISGAKEYSYVIYRDEEKPQYVMRILLQAN